MNFLPENIEHYTEAHTQPEPELLAQLTRETWQKVVNPRMLSGHVQGRFLSMVSHMIKPKRILEIGTYTGYSALCLAEGLAPEGELVTIDVNDELQWIQDKYFGLCPEGKQITRYFDNALTLLPAMDCHFDLVFMDADKENYLNYYHLLIDRLPSGAVILIDNVLWSGKVTELAAANDLETQVMQQLNTLVTNDTRVQNVLLPLRDGLMMLRKK